MDLRVLWTCDGGMIVCASEALVICSVVVPLAVVLLGTTATLPFPSGPNSSLAMMGEAKAPAAKLKCRACM